MKKQSPRHATEIVHKILDNIKKNLREFDVTL